MSAFPGDTVNPLDLTGFVFSRADLMQEVFAKYASVVDLLVLGWWAGDGDADWSSRMLEPLALAAADVDTPVVVSPVEATSIGAWVTSWRDRGVLFGRGIESVFHAADALDRFVAGPLAALASAGDDEGDEPAPGAAPELIASAAGPMVPFAEAMALLASAGIPVAPWEAVAPDAPGRRGGAGGVARRLPTRRQAGERPASHRARRRPGRRRRRGRRARNRRAARHRRRSRGRCHRRDPGDGQRPRRGVRRRALRDRAGRRAPVRPRWCARRADRRRRRSLPAGRRANAPPSWHAKLPDPR